MSDYQMGAVERRFARIIWEREPVSSAQLAQLALQELGWKKSTTYTVLKRLCEKGIFRNEKGCVTSLLTQQEFDALRSERFVEETFEGSLPAFLAAFTSRKPLSDREVALLRQMIERHEEG